MSMSVQVNPPNQDLRHIIENTVGAKLVNIWNEVVLVDGETVDGDMGYLIFKFDEGRTIKLACSGDSESIFASTHWQSRAWEEKMEGMQFILKTSDLSAESSWNWLIDQEFGHAQVVYDKDNRPVAIVLYFSKNYCTYYNIDSDSCEFKFEQPLPEHFHDPEEYRFEIVPAQ